LWNPFQRESGRRPFNVHQDFARPRSAQNAGCIAAVLAKSQCRRHYPPAIAAIFRVKFNMPEAF
jgi:hypothetical protein